MLTIQGIPYDQGHIDSSFKDPRWIRVGEPHQSSAGEEASTHADDNADEDDEVRLMFWFLGEDPEGPVAVCAVHPRNPEGKTTAGHFHKSDQLRLIVEGSLRIGKTWYKAGEMRIQQANAVYGPEEVGVDGCREIMFFSRRGGLLPMYKTKKLEMANAPVAEYLIGMIAPACGNAFDAFLAKNKVEEPA